MYWKYVARRLVYCLATYVVIIFIYSALFNTVMDATLKSQLEDQVKMEMQQQNRPMSAEERVQFIQERLAYLENKYHLNEPTINRIFWRAIDTITFDFGKSTHQKSNATGSNDVLSIVMEAIPNTVLLFTTAMVIDIIIGIILGLKKAQKPNGLMDRVTSIITMIVYGLPTWWLAMIFIMFFVYIVPIFPSGGVISVPPPTGFAYFIDLLYHLTLPIITLVIVGFWGRAYLTRNIVLGTLQEDFIMSARARGLSETKVLYGHTLRTAAPPIVTMSLMSLLGSISGGLLFEGIFSWPGMGNLYWISVQQNDIPVLMGNLALSTMLYLGGLVVLDLIYGFLDPRIKVGGKA